MTRYFPFFPLGLRCNPFRVPTDEEWAHLAILPPSFLQFATPPAGAPPSPHLQIIGDAGHGKSTLLRGLTLHFQQHGRRVAYEYLSLGTTRFTSDPTSLDAFLLDEAQRLSRSERRRLLQTTNSPSSPSSPGSPRLFLATHEDLTPLFKDSGLPLHTLNLKAPAGSRATSLPPLIQQIVERRLHYFSLPDGPRVTFCSDAYPYLATRFGADLRSVDSFLYDTFQQLPYRTPLPLPFALTAAHLRTYSGTHS